ncbi:GTP cyclohydrolase II [Myxococcota bacterium]|nr:GTP cyclohydrolase II [Myxococcota bacterium]
MTSENHASGLGGTLLRLDRRQLETHYGEFTVHVFHDAATRQPVLALTHGDVRGTEALLTRVHSSCVTSESYRGCDCDCAVQLAGALRTIAAAGRGVVFYLLQEGRGAGFVAKARDRMLVQASGNRLTTFDAYREMGLVGDLRGYAQVAVAARSLGVTADLALLTNNPDKLAALEAEGVKVAHTVSLEGDPSPFNLHYLAAKSRSGHAFEDPSGVARDAELPETVQFFEPRPLPQQPRFLQVAAYLLPVAISEIGPSWFWLHLYLDRVTALERVVLSYAREAVVPLRRVVREPLLARFPGRTAGPGEFAWPVVAEAIVQHGAGCAAFLPTDLGDPATCKPPAEDEAASRLLDHHVQALGSP